MASWISSWERGSITEMWGGREEEWWEAHTSQRSIPRGVERKRGEGS